MDKFFFKPRVGAYYDTGLINGIKVMILGASHYCLYNEKSTEFNVLIGRNAHLGKIEIVLNIIHVALGIKKCQKIVKLRSLN